MELEDAQIRVRIFCGEVDGAFATMNIGFLIPPPDCSSNSTSSSTLSEQGQLQQPAPSGTFSALLLDVAQSIYDDQSSTLTESANPIEPHPSTDVDDHVTGAALSGSAVASLFAVHDFPAAAWPVAGKAESLEDSTKIQLQNIELTPLPPQGESVVAYSDDRTMRTDFVPVVPFKPVILDSSINSPPRPVPGLDHSGEGAASHEGVPATDGLPARNDRSALVVLPPDHPEQQFGNPPLAAKMPPGSLITDQGLAPVMEDQGAKIVISAASVNVGGQSLERLSAGVQPLAMVHEQGAQPATLSGQSLTVPVISVSGGGQQDPFGSDAQTTGDGTFFRSGDSGAPESVTRGNQSQFFNSQFTSALQAQSTAPGEGSTDVTPAADRLKMTQAFLGEDHSTAMTAASGKVQSVHVELPAHDSGPLSVRISMTDQIVNTQFTTDRNDLGALLFTRQDQLQQSLAKSGLELGQFQVHIDQRNQQESLPDRQPRRNGEAPEQQPASQDRNQHAQDRERPNHRSPRALNLFA